MLTLPDTAEGPMRLLVDFSVATGVALLFLLLAWVSGRVLSGGEPLSRFKRMVLVYGFAFVLGTGYLMMLVADFHLRRERLFPAIVVWGAAVAAVAWWRGRLLT